MMGRRADIDLTGKQFYELYVNGPSDIRIRNRPTWDCTCSCGKQCNYTTYELTSGKRKACGHLRGQSRTLDLTGKVFNDLTVLYKVQNKGNNKSPSGNTIGRTYWHCRCVCGIECDVQTSDLTSGHRKDCGHIHKEYMSQKRTKDIVGLRSGIVTVIEMLPSKKTSEHKWRAMCRCKCDCGNIFDTQADYIKSGDTQSCGCLTSVGEYEISKYLTEKNILFKKQFRFTDLKTPNNGYCYFDFGVLNNDKKLKFLIEFQGKQHYEEMPGPWDFGKFEREVTDPLKREYCSKHNIPLYEIKYDSNIKEELDKIFAC